MAEASPVYVPLAITSVSLVVFTMMRWYSNSAKSPKLPPGPWKLPFFGNVHHLIGSSDLHHRTFTDLAKKHGPIMHLQLGAISVIVISSTEITEEVMKTQETNFAQRFQLLDAVDIPYKDSSLVFAPYNEYYNHIRKISVGKLLSPMRVRMLRSVREEEVWSLVESIAESQGTPINLSAKFLSLSNDIITRSVLGNKSEFQEEFKSALDDVVNSTKSFGVDDVFPFLKFLSPVTGKRAALKRVFEKMDKILEGIIEEHKRQRANQMEEDLLDVLLKEQQGGDAAAASSSINLTHDHIKNLILDIFAAGSMAVRSVLEWAMAEMLKNPEIMEKAQIEVRNAAKVNRITNEADTTQELPYLKLIIKETIRLHMPTPLIPREARKTCQIHGYDVPAKTKILVDAWAMSRDPKYWTDVDPEIFEPERVFPGNSLCMEYIPFGAGTRKCPGGLFGSKTIELALAQLLFLFNWKLPQGIEPEELDMNEASEITIRRKKDLFAVAIHSHGTLMNLT